MIPEEAMPTATKVMDRVADERTPLVAITTEDGNAAHGAYRAN